MKSVSIAALFFILSTNGYTQLLEDTNEPLNITGIPAAKEEPPIISEKEALGMEEAAPQFTVEKQEPSEAALPAAPEHETEVPQTTTQVRKEVKHAEDLPHDWSAAVLFTPIAFKNTNFKAQNTSIDVKSPKLRSIAFQIEKPLFQSFGILSLNGELGIAGTTNRTYFEKFMTAIMYASPAAIYRLAFSKRQWVVPSVKFGADLLRYNYKFYGTNITGFRPIYRGELALDILLNPLDPTSASDMHGNFSIQRTYLTLSYYKTTDSSKKDIDLSDSTFRGGIRFDF